MAWKSSFNLSNDLAGLEPAADAPAPCAPVAAPAVPGVDGFSSILINVSELKILKK